MMFLVGFLLSKNKKSDIFCAPTVRPLKIRNKNVGAGNVLHIESPVEDSGD